MIVVDSVWTEKSPTLKEIAEMCDDNLELDEHHLPQGVSLDHFRILFDPGFDIFMLERLGKTIKKTLFFIELAELADWLGLTRETRVVSQYIANVCFPQVLKSVN